MLRVAVIVLLIALLPSPQTEKRASPDKAINLPDYPDVSANSATMG
jgi:hypothetical protein